MTIIRLLQLFGVALVVMAANVAATILYMVVYGHLINPGHPKEYYHEHAQVAAPYCSIVFGIPIFFLAGWWVGGWWNGEAGVRAALIVWLIYGIIDGAIITAAGWTPRIAWLVAASLATKLIAAYAGATVRAG